jgi:hypothetical protein
VNAEEDGVDFVFFTSAVAIIYRDERAFMRYCFAVTAE